MAFLTKEQKEKKKEENKNKVTRTIKQQIRLKSHNLESDEEAWSVLNDLFFVSRNIANATINTCHYLDAKVSTEAGIMRYDGEKKEERLERIKQKKQEMAETFGVKEATQVYRAVTSEFPDVSSSIVVAIQNDAMSQYKNDRKEMLQGERSIRTYKKGYPVPFVKNQVSWSMSSEGKYEVHVAFTHRGKRGIKLTFEVVLGTKNRRNPNIEYTIKQIVNGEKDFGDPIKIKKDEKKLYLLVTVKDNKQEVILDDNTFVGVDLGIKVPAYCAINTSSARLSIGSIETFLRVRTNLSSQRKRLQRELRYAKGGKGRKKKLQALDRLRDKESNFRKTKNHEYSSAVVKFAVENRASIIKLEMLEGYGKDNEGIVENKGQFLLRYWSYYDLQTKITYKAKKYGIKVVFIDPYHTSQTCSKCGHYEPGQRISQGQFICACCDEEFNADYNAAVNIAKSTKIVTKKEDCEFHIKEKERKEKEKKEKEEKKKEKEKKKIA